jgi:hypothetical protein
MDPPSELEKENAAMLAERETLKRRVAELTARRAELERRLAEMWVATLFNEDAFEMVDEGF